MNVKSFEKNGNQATLVVEIDRETMESGVNKAYLKARRDIQIPGFRRGKAPRRMIESMYGEHVFYEDGLEEIFPEVYDFAVSDTAIRPVGQPHVTNMDIGEDNLVSITLTTELYPEVTLGQYRGLEVERPEAVVTEEEIQKELDDMAQKVASVETVDRPAQMGDTANIDYEGFLDGVPFDGGEDMEYDLELGSGSFIPGFEEQVVGMSAGEEKDLTVTFPEDYHASDLAGKEAVFHVTMNKVTVTNVPEQDDEFASEVSEFSTLEELKADIRSGKLAAAQKRIDGEFEEAALAKAAENTTVELPNALVDAEVDEQMERFAYQLQMSGYTLEQYARMMGGDLNTLRSAFRPMAEKRARENVTLEKIVEAEGLTATDEEVDAEYAAMAEKYDLSPEGVAQMVSREDARNTLATRKAIRLVVDSAVPVAPKAPEAEPAAEESVTEEAAAEEAGEGE